MRAGRTDTALQILCIAFWYIARCFRYWFRGLEQLLDASYVWPDEQSVQFAPLQYHGFIVLPLVPNLARSDG